jgi:ParB-like chromosome segregation protein Spo0J
MGKLNITETAIGALKPYPRNARTHSKKQLRQIAESIKKFGWTNPVLTDGCGMILAGHGRVQAAKLLGLSEVPVICIDTMSDSEKRAYILADNKLAENAGWDDDLLATELQFLTDIELDFDVELTGFGMGEIDVLLSRPRRRKLSRWNCRIPMQLSSAEPVISGWLVTIASCVEMPVRQATGRL